MPVSLQQVGSSITINNRAACVARRDGTVWCWGTPGWLEKPTRPFKVPGVEEATAVAVTRRAVCALVRSGRVLCHGADLQSEETEVATRRLGDASDVVDIAAWYHDLCLLRRSGRVECFLVPQPDVEQPAARRVVENIGEGVRLVASARDSGCAVLKDGRVACWKKEKERLVAALVPSITDAVDAAGDDTYPGCFVRRDGKTLCHGFSGYEVLSEEPGPVVRLQQGDVARCALLQGGDVTCTGSGSYGQLGDGIESEGMSRLKLGARAIAVGWNTVCVHLEDDGVVCWGMNAEDGLLGRGTGDLVREPKRIALSGPAHDIDVDEGMTCAALASSVECWGRKVPNRLGFIRRQRHRTDLIQEQSSRSKVLRFFAPQTVFDGPAESVRLGVRLILRGHPSVSLPRDLQTGLVYSMASPQRLEVLDEAVSFDVDGPRIFAVTKNGAVVKLQESMGGNPPSAPVTVPGVARASAVSFPYVLLRDGRVLTLEHREKAKPVDLGFRAHAIAAKRNWMGEFCAVVSTSGEVHCFREGEPANGLAHFTSTLRGVKALSLGHSGTENVLCVVLGDKSVRCAGERRGFGGLVPIEQDLSSLSNVRKVVVGTSHACALSEEGTVHCWGSNDNDQIADDPLTFSAVPIPIVFEER